MTLATRTLRLHLLSVLGAPLPGAKVTLRLSSYQADDNDIVPLNWVLPEDPAKPGDYVAPVWPNTSNDGGTHYDMLVQASGQQLLAAILTVPAGAGEAVHTAKINQPPYPPVYAAEKAVADANTFADAAGESASRTLAAVDTVKQVMEDYETVGAAAALASSKAALATEQATRSEIARDETFAARDLAFAMTNSRPSVPLALADNSIPIGGIFAAPGPDGWQAYTKTSGTVATPIGPVGATAQSVLYASMVTVSPESAITIDMSARTVTIGAGSAFFYRSNRLPINPQVINFLAADTGVFMRLYYDPATGVGGVAVGVGSTMPGGVVLLAYLFREKAIANDPDGRIVVLQSQRLAGPMEPFRPLIGGAITINMQGPTLRISTSALGFVPSKRNDNGGFLQIPAGQSVPISAPSGLVSIHAHPVTGALAAWNLGAPPPPNWPLLAVVLNNVLYKPSTSNIMLVMTNGAEYADPARTMAGAYFADAALTINLATLTLSLASSSGIAVWSDGYRSVASQPSVAFTMPFPNGLLWVYVNKSTGVIGAMAAGSGVPPVGSAVVAEVYGQKLDAPLDSRRQIKLIDTSGSEVPSSGGAAFDPLVQRMILPDTMYFVQNKPMRLYRAPCFADFQNTVRTDIAFWLDTNGSSIADRFQPVGDSIKLDPAQLGATFQLCYRHNAQPDKRYIKTITCAVAAPNALNGKTIRHLRIADSLGEVRMMSEIKTQLEGLGATVIPVGTYFSTATEGLRGEARGFWAYRNFIGKDNLSNVNGVPTPHTLAPPGPDSTKFANPFLRLATVTDKTNNPTWCFRNTASEKELSYADDPDKTGNFYVYDFGWYRAQHSVPAPDVITLAPWANDLNLDRSAYSQAERLQFMRLGLDIQIRSIKADLPNVKILILPAPAWCSDSVNDPRWLTEAAIWVEWCMKDVAALSATFTGLHLVGSWPFMSEDWNYPYNPAPPDLSATNNTKVNTIFDRVHFGTVGQEQSASVEVACIANVL
ncbi:hypothetical protein [Variovorax sp. DAIF25]|uniref:hypothetical protein n=1 Tax=Variovorax sp. DAIF25 TaxID=3080983 RepID=UPI003D6C2152